MKLATIAALTIFATPALADDPKGNAACWGDDTRQDISCTKLTEDFVFSLRGATIAQVRAAMGVDGRTIRGRAALHFISNYDRGASLGSGDLNIHFDGDGHADSITGDVDAPNGSSGHYDFGWDTVLLAAGCSDLPGSRMMPCDQNTLMRIDGF